MRTTLDIDDDILLVAKELARRERLPAGRVISRLVRAALTGRQTLRTTAPDSRKASATGFRPFASRGELITDDQINALRDREGV